MMNETTEGFIVEYDVYRVSNVVESVDDDTWFEYQVELVSTSDSHGEINKTLDKWDSRLETYDGDENHRLTERKARHTCEEIKEDVEQFGKASEWFDV